MNGTAEYYSKKLLTLLRNQIIYWQQRGKIKWVKFGDESTDFFHAKASINHRNNFIASIQNNDQMDITDDEGKAAILWESVMNRLGTTDEFHMHYDLQSLFDKNYGNEIFNELEAPF